MNHKLHKMELALFLVALVVAAAGIYLLGPSITGFVIKEFSYSKDLNLVVASSGNYTLELDELGELKSLKLDGKVTSYGTARVYIENNGMKYLVFDSTRLEEDENATLSNESNLITGFAVKEDEGDKKKKNKKPKWVGEDEFIVNGSIEINLSHYFADEDGDVLTYSVSDAEELTIAISNEIVTITPAVDNLNTTIIFIASDGIDSTSHVVELIVIVEKEKIVENKAPKWNSDIDIFSVNGTTTLNLSDYFVDDDGDVLVYSSGIVNEITITIENELATLIPAETFSGNATTIFTAFDGKNLTVQSVLLVVPEKVIEKNETINETPILNETKTINIGLDYNKGTIFDANDNGEESVNGVVDLNVANTKFNWNFDESKLCTRWEIYNAEEESLTTFCNGNSDCCAFVNLLPTKNNWSEVYYSTYGKDNAGHDNIVSAQVIYYDVNLSIENPKSEIYISDFGNLSVKFFEEEIEFFDECAETCDLSGFNKSSYVLVFEVEDDAILRIDKVKYDVLVDVTNNAPVLLRNFSTININKNKNITTNLSEYFVDPDGDILSYNYYKADNITILFDGDIATILPDKGIEGVRFTYIIANDSENAVISDVFAIKIRGNETLEGDYVFRKEGEETNISYYVELDNEKIKVKYKNYTQETDKFGFTFDEDEIEQELKAKKLGQGFALRPDEKIFNNEIYYKIESNEDYSRSFNPYMLERPLGYCKNITNQIGQIECREVKRHIDFSDILGKDHNLYNITKTCHNLDCSNSTTTKIPRNFSYSFIKQGKSWIIEFYNLFDLDPSFIDDTDSNWNSGTFNRMNVEGTGASANLSASNISGHYGSQIFDATSTANWTNITITAEAVYDIEIEKAIGDGIDSVQPFVNTTGLVLLLHFNNGTGENDSLIKDFSTELNIIKLNQSNGTPTNGAHHNFTEKRFGRASIDLDGTNDYVNVSDNFYLDFPASGQGTYSAWIKTSKTGVVQGVLGKGDIGGAFAIKIVLFVGGDNKGGFYVGDSAGTTIAEAAATTLTDGIWHLLIGRYNNSVVQVIVDGKVDKSTTHSGLQSPANAYDLTIGNAYNNNGLSIIDGNIDEVAIWNRSLTDNEILNLYKRGAYRFNLSARACDDSVCNGETYTRIDNITSQGTIPLNLTTRGRFFQYNITYSNESALTAKVIVNNVSINFVNFSMPIINTNYTTPTYPRFNQNTTLFINVTDVDSTIVYVNFTLIAPNGSKMLNNTNGTRSSGDLYNASFNLTAYGTWLWNVTVFDSDGFLVNTTTLQIILMELSETLTPSVVAASGLVGISGRANLSNGTNITNNALNFFLDGASMNANNSVFENATQWNVTGTAINVSINANNITLGIQSGGTAVYPNQTGNFTSGVIFVGPVFRNFTQISWTTEVPYGAEIGRAEKDGSGAVNPFINTSDLILLYHFNNESLFGENNSNFYDFSRDLNSSYNQTNGSCLGTQCPFYNASIAARFGTFGMKFDGSNDIINASVYDTGGKLDFGISNFTLSAWVKTSNTEQRAILDKGSMASPAKGYAILKQSTGYFRLIMGDGTTEVNLIGTKYKLDDGNWHYVVGTVNTTDHTTGANRRDMCIYVDGKLEACDYPTSSNVGSLSNGFGLIIGALQDAASPLIYWDGPIDEVSIWNRTLQSNEIENLYKRGVLRLNLSVRSCNDNACSGEQFSEVLENASGTKLNSTITPNNPYFQYKAVFSTEDVNYTPALYNVTINFSALKTNASGDYNFTFVAPSAAATYIVKVNSTWDNTIPGEQLQLLTVQNAQSINLAAGGAFIIQNSSGGNLAIIDSYGTMNIKGTITQSQEPTADYNDFVIQNSSGGLNLVITNPQGNLLIKNSLTQSQPSLSPTLRSFIIQNNTGATVAYVNSTGGLFLISSLTENVLFS